ncbi:hypothetical protein CHCC14820_1036 [Bacillus paralicheniformis]|nr:hypothetical protein CHCC14820_1036 [Bacillus paralicheniformis]
MKERSSEHAVLLSFLLRISCVLSKTRFFHMILVCISRDVNGFFVTNFKFLLFAEYPHGSLHAALLYQ